ncbi:hypothetical protein DFH09DRAFT_1182693, partial [Mycena vulgaris]
MRTLFPAVFARGPYTCDSTKICACAHCRSTPQTRILHPPADPLPTAPPPPCARACGSCWDCAQGVRGRACAFAGGVHGQSIADAYATHLLAEEAYRIAAMDVHLVVAATNAQRDDVFTHIPHASAAPDAHVIAAARMYTPHPFAGDAHLIPATNPHLPAHDAHALAADAQ